MNLRRSLYRVYWWMERRIVPGLRYSQLEYEDRLNEYLREGARWLDLGCGRSVLPSFRREAERRLVARPQQAVGVDPEVASLVDNDSLDHRIQAMGEALPFPDDHFDLVTANMLVEHLEEPEACFREVNRVLRPDGVFLFHTPNADAYGVRIGGGLPDVLKQVLIRVLEGRSEEDVFPTRYQANRIEDVARISEKANLTPERIDGVLTTASTAMLPFLAPLELLWLRRLKKDEQAHRRPVLIAVLRKPERVAADVGEGARAT